MVNFKKLKYVHVYTICYKCNNNDIFTLDCISFGLDRMRPSVNALIQIHYDTCATIMWSVFFYGILPNFTQGQCESILPVWLILFYIIKQ